ncbi:peroxiredoxin [Halobacteriales archaeon QS_4_69_34]|nr:MAG: peroxiredoxin [Halobacteriales archaeon QS_4_69_34]
MSTQSLDFELANAGPGSNPLALAELAADHDAVVLLFQRDHHCGNCREQVQDVAERYGEFADRDAEVVSVLPEPLDRAREWQDVYDLPFPLLADSTKRVGEQYGQPIRFGALGALHDLVGRMPEAVVLDTHDDEPEVAAVHRGDSPGDRPTVDALLERIDAVGAA